MLERANRLKKKKDFEEVIRRGQEVKGPYLVLKFLKRGQQDSRIGFVVSKKVSNKATVRNRTKRRMREAVKTKVGELKQGYDLVFFAKKNITETDFWALKQEIEGLLRRAEVIQNL